MLKYLFSIEQKSTSYVTLRILGIKFHILKPELRKRRKDYHMRYSNFDNAATIPKAEGTLRTIQLANLQLLKQFDKICKINNIKYWLDFGTLLGAQRHKGFIPWDDDIDIGMPRDDYERFINLFESGIPDYPDLYYAFSCNGNNKCFVKLHHKKTENLFIDIFPYDYHPDRMNAEEKQVFSSKIAKLINRKQFVDYKTPKKTREHLKKLTEEKLLCSKSSEKNSLFWGLDFPHRWVNKVYDYEQIFPLEEIQFEDAEFPAPQKPHEVLTGIYGNYMSIPRDVYPRHSDYNLNGDEKVFIENFAKGE